MKVFISRVSSQDQSELRQLKNVGPDFDKVVIDKCDGDIPLWERPEAKKLLKHLNKGEITHIEFHSVDRMGRNLQSILSDYQNLTDRGVRVICRNPFFQNFNDQMEPDIFSNLLLSIFGSISQYEKSLTKMRQKEGIKIARELYPEKYTGRKQNTKEDRLKFLSKYPKAIEYLKSGMNGKEVSKLCDLSENTVSKIRRLALG